MKGWIKGAEGVGDGRMSIASFFPVNLWEESLPPNGEGVLI